MLIVCMSASGLVHMCLIAIPEVLDVEFRSVNGLSYLCMPVVSKLWAADSCFCL
jgi:hypothetical protein